jgi:methionine-rich copper-binding protein CopC
MLRLPRPLLLAFGLLWGPLVGCGGGDTPPAVDAGPPPVDAGPPDAGPVDAGPLDRVPPIVTAHSPENGAVAVPPDRRIELTFSEPMQTQQGLLQLLPETAFPDNGRVKVRPQDWDATGRQVSFAFPGGLPVETEVTVTASQFLDLAGNPLPTFTFRFTVSDGQPPRVTASSPSEGASRVPLDTAQVSFTFNEPMDTRVGSLAPVGGLTLGAATWTGTQVLTAPITRALVNNVQYGVRLEGFRNVHGQAFSGAPTLGDGKLDFGTGPDLTPPTVVSSSPTEGATDVVTEYTTRVVLTFSEPMKKTVGKAELVDGSTRTVLTPTWTQDGFSVSYDVTFLLRHNAALGIALTGFQDAVGNALDPKPYLGNGVLDFRTVVDTTRPYLESSDPVDDAQNVYPAEVYLTGGNPATGLRKRFTFVFSEPMDTRVTRVTLHETASPGTFRSFDGAWGTDRRTLTVTIAPVATGQLPVAETRAYYMDLTGLKDAAGNTVETTFPGPGGDGRIGFLTLSDLPWLDHACAHALATSPTAVTATATFSGATPRTDTLHAHYALTLPGGNGSFTGYTRMRLGFERLYHAFMNREVPLEVTDGTNGAVLEVTLEAVPPACAALTHMATFRSTSNPELRARFGPAPAAALRLVVEEHD